MLKKKRLRKFANHYMYGIRDTITLQFTINIKINPKQKKTLYKIGSSDELMFDESA